MASQSSVKNLDMLNNNFDGIKHISHTPLYGQIHPLWIDESADLNR